MTKHDSFELSDAQPVRSESTIQPDSAASEGRLARLHVALSGVAQMSQIVGAETSFVAPSISIDKVKRLETALRIVSSNFGSLEVVALENSDDDDLVPGAKLTKDQTALVLEYMTLARSLARRYGRSGEDYDDLEQVAQLGLLKAAIRFKPELGFEFSTFATPTILGQIKRHFRDYAWSVSVPRRVKEIALQIPNIQQELANKYQRTPSFAEIAAELGVDENTVKEAIAARKGYRADSLDEPIGHEYDGITIGDSIRQEGNSIENVDTKILAENLLARLDSREQLVIRAQAGMLPGHYGEQFTQTEVAGMIGVSQMHVSRITTKALEKLSNMLAEDE